MALPMARQRSPEGCGFMTTFTGNGMTLVGHLSGVPNMSDIGTVSPWSTSSRFKTVMSKSSVMSEAATWVASSGAPSTTGMGRGP